MRLRRGRWHIRNLRTDWVMDGRILGVNAQSATIRDAPGWNAGDALSGDRLLVASREYAEDVLLDPLLCEFDLRHPVITERPREIQLRFPDLPGDFLALIRRMRTFAIPFVVELRLFDSVDPEPFYTQDGQYFYASHGGWKPDSVTIYVDGVEVTEGFLLDLELGYVRFEEPVAADVISSSRSSASSNRT